MNISEVIDFIKETKQPAAYFDTEKERFRFGHLEINNNNQRIYNYLNGDTTVQITIK